MLLACRLNVPDDSGGLVDGFLIGEQEAMRQPKGVFNARFGMGAGHDAAGAWLPIERIAIQRMGIEGRAGDAMFE